MSCRLLILLSCPISVVGAGMVIPGQDFRTAICARNPDSAICAVLVPGDNSVSNSQADLENQEFIFGLTSTNAPSTIRQDINEDQKRFCVAYSRHYKAYCTQSAIQNPSDLNQDQQRAQKFCGSYSGGCNGDYEIQIQEYCDKYQSHYQYFCKNPFDHGPKAAKFCPLYATKCNSRFEVPLFEPGVLFGTANEPKTTTPPGTSTIDWFYQPTTTCGLECKKPEDLTDAEIKQLCDQYRAQGERYCFGPIGDSPSYKQKCDYFKQYCVDGGKKQAASGKGSGPTTEDPWAIVKRLDATSTVRPRFG